LTAQIASITWLQKVMTSIWWKRGYSEIRMIQGKCQASVLSRFIVMAVILRSEAEPVLSEVEGKTLVFSEQAFCHIKERDSLRPSSGQASPPLRSGSE
jgi:hypothetical protein